MRIVQQPGGTRPCAAGVRLPSSAIFDARSITPEKTMRKLFWIALAAVTGVAPASFAAEGSVTITSPAEGAKLDAMAQNKIVYEVMPGARGDHVHLYVDGKEVAVLRALKGSRTLDTLAPGDRTLCIKVVNKAHTPIGVEKCVKVRVE